MDSAKSILHSIVLATQHVRNTIVRYSTTKGVRQVRAYSLVRLELEFQTIVDASRAILEVFDDPLLRRHYMLDDRLMDWLSGTEPETCLNTLKEIERLLNIDHEVQVFSGFTPTRTWYQEDDANRAITLFYTHITHFHFLLTADIWNYEKQALRETMPSKTEDKRVPSKGQSRSTSMEGTATKHLRKAIISQKLNKLLKILDPLDCSRKHRETSSTRQSDTCLWLPATDAYKSWREGGDTLLLLQGKAGAGKTVLASTIINDLDNTKGDGELLVYFYCDFRTKRSTSSLDVMRSLLAQLTEQLCVIMTDPEPLLDELLKGADSRVDPFYSVKGLANYLTRVAESCPRKPLLVVDALDECREAETLVDGLILCSGDVQMFVTSRPLQNIIQMLSPFPCVSMDQMENELSADILLHVTRELDSRCRLRTFDGRLKEEIRSRLCAKADGMFRWVQCQIDTLDTCSSVSEVRRVLESLPEGLEETYRRILIAIDRHLPDARLVRRALMWLVAALRPMRLRELLEGLTIDPVRRALDPGFILIKGLDFLEVSRSLVIHDKETDIVALSHMSVKEYLLGELVQAKLPRYHIALEDAHEWLARLCMAYISFCLEQMKECRDRSSDATREHNLVITTSYESRPLLKYVLADGFSHLAHLGSDNAGIFKDMETLQVVIFRHAWEWDRLCKSVPLIRSGIPWASSKHDFVMYTFVAFASNALFQTFLSRSTFSPREGTNPLVYAAHFGKTDRARALISRGANVIHRGLVIDELSADDSDADNMDIDGSGAEVSQSVSSIADCSDERSATPIQVAVDHWHAEMLDLLIAQGSPIPDGLLNRVLRVQPHRYPLYIIRRLLQTTEFVNWAVAPWDNQQLLEAIIEDGEDYEQINGRDDLMVITRGLVQASCAESLLLVAVERGCIPVIRTLLSVTRSLPPSVSHPNAIANALAANGDTPFHVAMRLSNENQCLVITELLAEAGCSPSGLDANDKPPIQAAVARGFISVVEYLLSRSATLPSKILFAALQATVVKRVEMVRLLIGKGANVHVLKPDEDTLLHATIRSLDRSICLEITKILVDVGCNSSAVNSRGETPLHIAVKQGYHEIVGYLILFSAASDISSLSQENPAKQEKTLCSLIGNAGGLRFSHEESSMQAVRQFLNDEDKCLEWTKVFIGDAGELFARSSGNAVLFNIALKRGFGKVLDYLASQDLLLPAETLNLLTALQCRPSIIPFLIRRGADVHIRNKTGDTLLHVAISVLEETQCLTITQTLVEAGCDPFILGTSNNRPIDIALSTGRLSVVEYLLSHALNTKSSLPPDLLAAFQSRGNTSTIQLLVDATADLSCLVSNGDYLLHAALALTDEGECLRATQLLCETDCIPFAPDANGKTPLHVAIIRGFTSVVDYLLSRNVPLPSDILFFALDLPPSKIYNGDTCKATSIISSLVRQGADVHIQDLDRNTLLHRTMLTYSESHCVQVAKIFIEAGCSASVPNASDKLPIELAVTNAHHSVVEYLLSRNAPFPSDILFTLCGDDWMFSDEFKFKMVSSFVEHGADARAIAPNGDTLLHTLLQQEMTDTMEDDDLRYFWGTMDVLIKANCNLHARDAHGRTPLELAEVNESAKVVEYLKRISPPESRRPPQPDSVRQAISKIFSRSPSGAGQTDTSDA